MILNEKFTLNNGTVIPKIGFGTWDIPNEIAERVISNAIEVGYRHIDTASAYQNEKGVGIGIKNSKIEREELYITTKIPAEIKSYDQAKLSIQQSLELLDTNYIDLLLIHAPKPWSEMHNPTSKTYLKENIEVWRAMEEAFQSGQVKSLGISNFSMIDVQNILTHAEVKPVINQIKVHIGHVPTESINFCKEKNILIEGYSPIAKGKLLTNQSIETMAHKYGVSVAQLCIKFVLQQEVLPLPKTTHKKFMEINTQLDFIIDKEDMEKLIGIK